VGEGGAESKDPADFATDIGGESCEILRLRSAPASLPAELRSGWLPIGGQVLLAAEQRGGGPAWRWAARCGIEGPRAQSRAHAESHRILRLRRCPPARPSTDHHLSSLPPRPTSGSAQN